MSDCAFCVVKPNGPWYERTIPGKMVHSILCFIVSTGAIIACFAIASIIGQIGVWTYPPLMAWIGLDCGNIFAKETTINNWGCHAFSGISFAVLFLFGTIMINLIIWPFHVYVWRRNTLKYIFYMILGLIPFYLHSVELLGVMATKIMKDPGMANNCNLNTYNNLMNGSCMRYGLVTVVAIVGIEIGIAILGAVCMTIMDCYQHGSSNNLTNESIKSSKSSKSSKSIKSSATKKSDTIIKLESDPQFATGNISTNKN